MPIDFGDFNLGFGGDTGFNFDPGFNLGFDPTWFNFGTGFDFNLPNFQLPDFNFNFPSLNLPQWADPLALPTLGLGSPDFTTGFQPAFSPQIPGLGDLAAPPALGMAGIPTPSPQTLDNALGFGSTAAPTPTIAGAASNPLGGDSLVNLMGTSQGLGYDPGFGSPDLQSMFGQNNLLGVPQGQPGAAFSPKLDTGLPPQASLADLQRQLYEAQIGALGRQGQPASTWDTIAKLGAGFGPVALGGAGLLMQALNQPKRNPLDDQLKQAQIASIGSQDSLARDRLQFERDQQAAMLEAQQAMQNALLESRAPGGPPNIQALLQSQPQLAALYNALTAQTTGLAGGGSPEFNALIDQIANVETSALARQRDEAIAQANEQAQRLGTNPAGIIAKVQQEYLQQAAAARQNARAALIQQLQPGINTFNSVANIFGNLAQIPSFG